MLDIGWAELWILLFGIGLGIVLTLIYLVVFGKDEDESAED